MKSKKLLKIIVFLLPVLVYTFPLNGQEKEGNCAINLRLAQTAYEAGQIEGIPALITGCIKSGFTKEEKIQAYKLLINAYIFDDNIEKAEQVMYDFLVAYPEYEVIATDPNEFADLMNQFDNRPRYSVGVMAGGNLSQIRILENIATYETKGNVGNYKSGGLGFQAGLLFAKNLTDVIELNLEVQYKLAKYSFNVSPDSFSTVKKYETQSVLLFPVSVSYKFLPGKFSPYGRLGLLTGYMLTSGADLVKTFKAGTATPLSGEQIDLINKRNRVNMWIIIGGGVKYKISKGYIRADIRYNLGLKNQVSNNSWKDKQSDLEWKYGYRDDKNVRDDLTFSIGYVRTIYHPRKKL
jgi:hypothetical protein